jgi:hypothetical protein
MQNWFWSTHLNSLLTPIDYDGHLLGEEVVIMLFGKKNKKPKKTVDPYDPATNGPNTPAIGVAAMKRALTHAAWRDPSVGVKRDDVLREAVSVLEHTAACADSALERLGEAAQTLAQGREADTQVMRGLLTARFEEVLDSLERLAKLAGRGGVNLLDSASKGLSVDFGNGGFRYALNPIDIRRDKTGLDIPVLLNGFDDEVETETVGAALERAQRRVGQFADRLFYDATMLINLMKAEEQHNETVNAVKAIPAAFNLPDPSTEEAVGA